jgi:hypothetical protein
VEIQQAKQTRAELTVLPDSATDTGNRSILDDHAAKQYQALQNALNTAKGLTKFDAANRLLPHLLTKSSLHKKTATATAMLDLAALPF